MTRPFSRDTLDTELADLVERERSAAPQDSSERLIPLREAADRRGVSRATIYKYIQQERLTKHVVGGRTHVDVMELEGMLLEPVGEPLRPARRAAPPRSVNESATHIGLRLRGEEEGHRRRLEGLLEQLVDDVRTLKLLVLSAGGRP